MKRKILTITLCVAVAAVIAASMINVSPARAGEDSAKPEADHGRRISLLHSAILGVVEGLTEYLPVSSTGHLILTSHTMGLSSFTGEYGPLGPKISKDPALSSFEIVIQLGAILAVVGLYRRRVGQMFRGLAGKEPAGLRLAGLLFVAFLPAAVIGLLFHDQIKEYLFGPLTVAWALAVGGVFMIAAQYIARRRKKQNRVGEVTDVLYVQALVIGFAQCLAMWPGTSRSMITIVAGLLVGLDMVTAAEFSFLLALPTLGAATIYEGVKDYSGLVACAGVDGLLVGLVVSCIVAAVAVAAFVRWLTKHGMMPFGIYRIILAAVVYWYFFM